MSNKTISKDVFTEIVNEALAQFKREYLEIDNQMPRPQGFLEGATQITEEEFDRKHKPETIKMLEKILKKRGINVE